MGPVLAFNVDIPYQVECLAVFACWKQAQDLCVSLLFVQHLYIFQYVTQNSTFTRQTTLSFIILILIIMYTLVSGVHVCYVLVLILYIMHRIIMSSIHNGQRTNASNGSCYPRLRRCRTSGLRTWPWHCEETCYDPGEYKKYNKDHGQGHKSFASMYNKRLRLFHFWKVWLNLDILKTNTQDKHHNS